MTYSPPKLREVQKKGKQWDNSQFNVINPIYRGNLVLTYFMVNLAYLPADSNYFKEKISIISSKNFNHISYLVNVPNHKLQNKYFDTYFSSGKGGYKKVQIKGKEVTYPIDCRIRIKSEKKLLKYKTITGTPNRFYFLPYSTKKAIKGKEDKIEIFIIDPKTGKLISKTLYILRKDKKKIRKKKKK